MADLDSMPEGNPIGRIDHCGVTVHTAPLSLTANRFPELRWADCLVLSVPLLLTQVPEAGMSVLATGTAGDHSDTAISWLVKPNVLIITAVLHSHNECETGNPGDLCSSFSDQQTAETISHLARQFMASRVSAENRWSGLPGPSRGQQVDGGSDDSGTTVVRQKHEAGLQERCALPTHVPAVEKQALVILPMSLCFLALLPASISFKHGIDACSIAIVAHRPDFRSTQTELEEKSQALSKVALASRLMSPPCPCHPLAETRQLTAHLTRQGH